MARIILAYLLIGIFFGTERRLRRGQTALTFEGGRADRGSTRLIGMAFGIMINALLLAPLLNRFRIGKLRTHPFILWMGIPLMAAGILLRVWSSLTLGEFNTRTLVTTSEQHLVEAGPYRLLRNPGYLGNISMWLGATLATGNWIALILTAVTMLTAYVYRIHSEEEMLTEAFGREFEDYRARTWRLIPGIY